MSESQPCIDGRFNAMSRSVSARIGAGSGREQCRFGESVLTKTENLAGVAARRWSWVAAVADAAAAPTQGAR